MGTCNSSTNSVQMKHDGNMNPMCTKFDFRKIGSKIDCKHNNGRWYSAEILLYLNCKQTSILVHYTKWSNKSDEWISIDDDMICYCYGECHKPRHRVSAPNTQTQYGPHLSGSHIEASLTKHIDASISAAPSKYAPDADFADDAPNYTFPDAPNLPDIPDAPAFDDGINKKPDRENSKTWSDSITLRTMTYKNHSKGFEYFPHGNSSSASSASSSSSSSSASSSSGSSAGSPGPPFLGIDIGECNKRRDTISLGTPSPRSPSSPKDPVTLKRGGKDNKSIILEYGEKSARISVDLYDGECLGVFYNEIKDKLIEFGLKQFRYKLPSTYRWINNKTRKILGPNTKLENLEIDVVYELRLKRQRR